jgi:phosphoglycerol transferase
VSAPRPTVEHPPPSARRQERRATSPRGRQRSEAAFPVEIRRLALEVLLVAVAALGYAAVLYHVWDARWDVPLYEEHSDARGVGAFIRTIAETGWWVHTDRLGAPFGQNLHDFPANGEFSQIVAIRILAELLPSYAHVMNVYYLAGFGVLAGVAFLVLRHLRVPLVIAAIAALTYSFLPFHLVHEQSHLTRSTYLTGPLACLLLLWTLSWRSFFLIDADPPPRTPFRANLRRGRVLAAITLTAFTVTLLAAAAIVTAVRWREPARLAIAGGLIAIMLAAFLVVSFPSLNYWRLHGSNPAASQRQVAESEYYSLKISRLVLPQSDHRLAAWGEFGQKAQMGSPLPTEGGQYLGILGIAGLLGAFVGLFGHGLRGPARRDPRPPTDRQVLNDNASLLVVLCVVIGTVAGFNVVIAVFGFEQVRTWGRIEVILAFLALLIVALWFERLAPWLRRRVRRPAPILAIVAVAVGAFALWDGIPPAARDYDALAAQWDSDEAFVSAIERRMPDGAAIFQFPAQPFPEAGPLNGMLDYDHFRGYLHDDGTLRWSYGAVKGRRRADWHRPVNDVLGPVGALEGLLGLGFTGYWIDTAAWNPEQASELRRSLDRTLRTQPLESRDGRFLFYDLRPFKQRLGRSDDELRLDAARMFGI